MTICFRQGIGRFPANERIAIVFCTFRTQDDLAVYTVDTFLESVDVAHSSCTPYPEIEGTFLINIHHI